jgi:hypothetical protein
VAVDRNTRPADDAATPTTGRGGAVNRKDIADARDLAEEFVRASNELLAKRDRRWNHETEQYVDHRWDNTWTIAGKQTGAHRRLSLDLTRALAHMRRRS